MRTFIYPAVIEEPYPNDFVVRFPDVPEAITGGDTLEQALAQAVEALEVAVEFYLNNGRAAPVPRQISEGEYPVALAPTMAARVLLTEAMAAQGLSKTALAGRMRKDEKVVRRILSGKGASFELTLDALRAVGIRPALSV
jgi:antitoxin HicB